MSRDERTASGEPIRVLLAAIGRDPVPDDLAGALRQMPDVRLIGTASGPTELLLFAADGVDIVVIVTTVSYPPPGVCSHLLSEWPNLRIIIVGEDGKPGVMYWLGLRRRRLPAGPPASLVAHIRTAFTLDPMA